MSKGRFTTIDVTAMVREVRATLGTRLANVYDVDSSGGGSSNCTKFILKMADKTLLLVESGVRFHRTKFIRDKNDMPSPFTMKLRKHIRLKKLEDIRQPGNDRVVDFRFGSGEQACHLILELYAKGNIVLTDTNYEIICLLRSHQFEEDVAVKVGEIYPLAYTTDMTGSSLPSISSKSEETNTNISTLQHTLASKSREDVSDDDVNAFIDWCREMDKQLELVDAIGATINGGGKRGGKFSKKKTGMRQFLISKESPFNSFGPEIVEHCLLCANVENSLKLNNFLEESRETHEKLLRELVGAKSILGQLNKPSAGYIILKSASKVDGAGGKIVSEEDGAQSVREFVEFVPLLLSQHQDKDMLSFPTFEEAVDLYFGNIEDQRLAKQAIIAEEAARSKVHKVTSEQQGLIAALSSAQTDLEDQAMLVEFFADEVDKVSVVLNSAVAAGMSWDDISEMVRVETERGNPIAALVHELRLEKSRVVIRLEDPYKDDDEGEGAISSKLVEIDLGLTAHANARRLHGNRKVAKEKESKTIESASRVIKSVEAQAMKTLDAQKIKRNLQTVRHVHWFERFNWFITSEGYLCLSGRDAQQNELLVKRYLRQGDAYVHAEIGGASSCVLRRKDGTDPSVLLSPLALQEAGAMTICRSGAWGAKAHIAAYWVHADQVSKAAPTGEYLSTGSFMIYGRKNYLPPAPLEMGFGVLFRLDDSSVFRHVGERRDRALYSDDGTDKYSTAERSDWNEADAQVEASTESLEAGEAEPATNNSVHELGEEGEEELENNEDEDEPEAPTPEVGVPAMMQKIAQKFGDSSTTPMKPTKEKKDLVSAPTSNKVINASAAPVKRKNISKKKLRRYEEQDEEDRALAMRALGHLREGEERGQEERQHEEERRLEDRERRQAKAGVKSGTSNEDWSTLLNILGPLGRGVIEEMIVGGKLREGELDAAEMRAVAAYEDSQAAEILVLFRDGLRENRVGNKSGFLAGIIRRYAKDLELQEREKAIEKEVEAVDEKADEDSVTDEEDKEVDLDEGEKKGEEGELSRRERKRLEAQEIAMILEEEGVADESAGLGADELSKLTAAPLPEDQLLYAIPMCGPYSSFSGFKFKVKLTPGTQKKGKAAKQAIEVFSKSRDASAAERALLRGLTDPEMVAIMIGEVKLSVPGLQLVKQALKSAKKKTQRGEKKVSHK